MSEDRIDARRALAISEALDALSGRLRALVRARVPEREVDDLLQLAALRAVERAATLRDVERVDAWLYRIHRNVIADATRERARHREDPTPAPDPDGGENPGFVLDELCRCSVSQAQRLPANHGEILTMVDMGDATLAEAAESLGITVNNATVRLHRARRALQKRMKAHCGVTSLRECAGCRCIDDGCCAA